MFRSIRNDIKVIFERDPAARSVLEIFLCYPGFHAVRFPSPRPLALDARSPGPRPLRFPHLANRHGDRDPPGSDDRRRVLHRSRHGGGDRRDVGDRQQRHPVPRRDPGRDELEQGKRHPTLEGQRDRRAGAAILGPIRVGTTRRSAPDPW